MFVLSVISEDKMDYLYNHWKCSECHHEWDGEENTCDWCGSKGRLLEKTSKKERAKLFDTVRRVVKCLKGN